MGAEEQRGSLRGSFSGRVSSYTQKTVSKELRPVGNANEPASYAP